MRGLFAAALTIHGLIHLIGPAKAFGLAELPSLQPISRPMGLAWLSAAALFVMAGVCLFAWPRGWWAIATLAVLISQGAIVAAWSTAKFGSVLNILVLAGVFFGVCIEGPVSLRAQYEEDVDRGLARFTELAPIGEADLATLPDVVQRYLRASGVVGMARPHNVRVRMHGRIRSGPDAAWMAFTAEQYNFFDRPARLFYMEITDGYLAVQGFHRYVGPVASMRVNVAGLVPVVRAGGEEFTSAETVTMLNDMAVLAPATLLDPAISWTVLDDGSVRASFENAMLRIHAVLEFNDAGELANFWSDDRVQLSADGTMMRRMRWSTPLSAYRSFGPIRLSAGGEGRWHDPEREYAYIEVSFDDIQYNLRRRVSAR